MRVLLAALWLLTSCRNPHEVPAYLVGPSSYALVIAPDGLATTFYRVGDTVSTAFPGDSICIHFVADNSWQTLVMSNATYSFMVADWLPHDSFPHMTWRFTGPASRQLGTASRALC